MNAFERALCEVPVSDPRHRIEHFFFAGAEQSERAQSLSMMVSHQPAFLYAMGEAFEARISDLGFDAPPMPYRTMLDAGLAAASGSDLPCAPVEPLLGLSSLLSRCSRHGGDSRR